MAGTILMRFRLRNYATGLPQPEDFQWLGFGR
jgi:hypothetical protein